MHQPNNLTGFISYLLNQNDVLVIGDKPSSKGGLKFISDHADLFVKLGVKCICTDRFCITDDKSGIYDTAILNLYFNFIQNHTISAEHKKLLASWQISEQEFRREPEKILIGISNLVHETFRQELIRVERNEYSKLNLIKEMARVGIPITGFNLTTRFKFDWHLWIQNMLRMIIAAKSRLGPQDKIVVWVAINFINDYTEENLVKELRAQKINCQSLCVCEAGFDFLNFKQFSNRAVNNDVEVVTSPKFEQVFNPHYNALFTKYYRTDVQAYDLVAHTDYIMALNLNAIPMIPFSNINILEFQHIFVYKNSMPIASCAGSVAATLPEMKFTSGKEFANFVLQKPEHKDLQDFAAVFLQELKNANPGRIDSQPDENKRLLDTLSKLLVGNETCSAVALSGPNLLIATNEHLHENDFFRIKKRFKVLRKFVDKQCLGYEVVFTDILSYEKANQTPKVITKHSGVITYRWQPATQKFELIDGNPKIEFTSDEHQIANYPWPISQVTTYKREFFSLLAGAPENQELHFPKMPICEANALRRRANTLISSLAMIAHGVKRPDLKSHIAKLIETNKYWSNFLNSSLTYELSKLKEYKTHINLEDFSHPAKGQLLGFYDFLIADYQSFKQKKRFLTTQKSIGYWLKTIEQLNPSWPAPDFIRQTYKPFFDKAKEYFINLIKVEEFVKRDATNNGRLSSILVTYNFFERDNVCKIIDGVENMHAEMRLLEYHLLSNPTTQNYFGISKLCCALCTYTLKRFDAVAYRGSHAILYANWVLSNVIKQKFLPKFLGDKLYQMYLALSATPPILPPGVNKQSKNRCRKEALALTIIPIINEISDPAILKKLQIDQKFLLHRSPRSVTNDEQHYLSSHDIDDEQPTHSP